MLHSVIFLFYIILCSFSVELEKIANNDLGAKLVSELTNDANLDLSEDVEYEDLRAELLAYHTALASLSEPTARRSMLTTPCWSLGGICINNKLCTGFKSLSEVAGCRDKLNVCCFVWNKYNVRDMREHGIRNMAMPWWSRHEEAQGKGIVAINKFPSTKRKKNKRKHKETLDKSIAYIIRTNVNE